MLFESLDLSLLGLCLTTTTVSELSPMDLIKLWASMPSGVLNSIRTIRSRCQARPQLWTFGPHGSIRSNAYL
ncbi:hypothetical protein IW261DRAFT_1431602, partial [Armillaria novae-zelandiae]